MPLRLPRPRSAGGCESALLVPKPHVRIAARESLAALRVALTGATGFTGRRVVAELLLAGHEVVALVRPPLQGRDLPAAVSCMEGDMADASALRRLLERADAFVHVASLGFGHADAVASAVAASGVARSVFFSS